MEEDFTCPICLERGNKMIKFLKEAIEKKEQDLKCPICLERAQPPIFMCPASHIICSACGPKVQKCPECREELPTPLWRWFFLFVPFSPLIFLFFLWAPFFICPGTAMLRKLAWTWKTCCNNLWNWLEMIQRKKLKGHLVIIKFRILFPLMIIELSFDDDITKPIISLSHIFSLWTMCILQGRSLSLSLHRSQRSSIVASPSPTALSSTSCWSLVRGGRWWAGGGSSTEIFSQELARSSYHQGILFQRWDAELDWSAGLR